jgi:hypothetical protein
MAGRVVACDYRRLLTANIARSSPPNPRMQPTGRSARRSVRAAASAGAARGSVGLCGRRLERLQLMRMSLGGLPGIPDTPAGGAAAYVDWLRLALAFPTCAAAGRARMVRSRLTPRNLA